jgi:hypothetical protein
MGTLILLLCTLPPLAVMAVAAAHSIRTGSPAVSSMLVASALVLTASVMLPLMQDEEPVQTVRFAVPRDSDMAAPRSSSDPVQLVDRWGTYPAYQ